MASGETQELAVVAPTVDGASSADKVAVPAGEHHPHHEPHAAAAYIKSIVFGGACIDGMRRSWRRFGCPP